MEPNKTTSDLAKEIQELILTRVSDQPFIFSLTMVESQNDGNITCGAMTISNIDDSKTPFAVVRALVGGYIQIAKQLLLKFDPNSINVGDKKND